VLFEGIDKVGAARSLPQKCPILRSEISGKDSSSPPERADSVFGKGISRAELCSDLVYAAPTSMFMSHFPRTCLRPQSLRILFSQTLFSISLVFSISAIIFSISSVFLSRSFIRSCSRATASSCAL
jgi:hypothetical protein